MPAAASRIVPTKSGRTRAATNGRSAMEKATSVPRDQHGRRQRTKMPSYISVKGRGAVLLQNRPRSLDAAQRQNLIGMTVDRSDSMDHLSEVAVCSLNELITQQKEIGAESRFTLTLFNNQISTIHDGIPLCDVP